MILVLQFLFLTDLVLFRAIREPVERSIRLATMMTIQGIIIIVWEVFKMMSKAVVERLTKKPISLVASLLETLQPTSQIIFYRYYVKNSKFYFICKIITMYINKVLVTARLSGYFLHTISHSAYLQPLQKGYLQYSASAHQCGIETWIVLTSRISKTRQIVL